jgi:superfamily II DNA helicase RecQ
MKKEKTDDYKTMVLVMSPLISLMKLQARTLRKRGITAAYLQVRYYSDRNGKNNTYLQSVTPFIVTV